MRIAFFVTDFPQLSETFIVNQVIGLIARGHDVHVFARRVFGEDQIHEHAREYRLLSRTSVRFHFSKQSPVRRIASRVLLGAKCLFTRPMLVLRSLNVLRYGIDAISLSLLDRSIFISSQDRFDVFHCHFGVNGEEAAILRQVGAFDAPIVSTFHGYDIRDGIEKGSKIYRHLLRYGDEIHCISEYNREHLEKFGFSKDKIVLMPIGIDLSRFADEATETQMDSSRARTQLRILTVARLSYEKGVDVALHAMAILRELRPEVDFFYTVIGDGPDRRDLDQLSDQLNLSRRVDLAGSADQRAVASELRKCDLFLLPSRAESLPVAIMEAMASGRAVVATQVGGVSELVVNGISGMLVRSEDPRDMAQTLSQLVSSADERARLGSAGRRLVQQRHNLAVLNDQLVERYARLCEL